MPRDAEDCQLSLPLQVQAPTPDLAAAGEAAARLRQVVLGGQLCHFRLRRARRRTIGFRVDPSLGAREMRAIGGALRRLQGPRGG